MSEREYCKFYDETLGCLDCYIERCPYDYIEKEKEKEETESSKKPALLIFQCLAAYSPAYLQKLWNTLTEQVKEGVVLLPPYVKVKEVFPADCEIRIVDKYGNVVEGEKVK